MEVQTVASLRPASRKFWETLDWDALRPSSDPYRGPTGPRKSRRAPGHPHRLTELPDDFATNPRASQTASTRAQTTSAHCQSRRTRTHKALGPLQQNLNNLCIPQGQLVTYDAGSALRASGPAVAFCICNPSGPRVRSYCLVLCFCFCPFFGRRICITQLGFQGIRMFLRRPFFQPYTLLKKVALSLHFFDH